MSFSTAEEQDGLSAPFDCLRVELSHETAHSTETVLILERQRMGVKRNRLELLIHLESLVLGVHQKRCVLLPLSAQSTLLSHRLQGEQLLSLPLEKLPAVD